METCAQTPPQEKILEDDRKIASSSAPIVNCENLIMVPIITEPDDQKPTLIFYKIT